MTDSRESFPSTMTPAEKSLPCRRDAIFLPFRPLASPVVHTIEGRGAAESVTSAVEKPLPLPLLPLPSHIKATHFPLCLQRAHDPFQVPPNRLSLQGLCSLPCAVTCVSEPISFFVSDLCTCVLLESLSVLLVIHWKRLGGSFVSYTNQR